MKNLSSFILLLCLLPSFSAEAQRKMTSFKPNQHGFKFVNTFHNNFVSEIDWRTGGLCGGMVYSALDYYNARKTIPHQDYRPNDGTALHTHIYSQQVESIKRNIDQWAELGLNPGGARNEEFFRWGMKDRLRDIIYYVDRNKPMPLGLMGAGGAHNGGEHQVLVIGYELGRYKGDYGAYQSDLKIFTYNPNYPDKVSVIRPDLRKKVFYTFDNRGNRKEWRTYFVDRKYQFRNPPYVVPENYPKDGKVYELVVYCTTGGDDLRGGRDNLDITINFHGQASQVVRNVNLSRRWINNYMQPVRIRLNRPIAAQSIKSLQLFKHASGGWNGDNWKLNGIKVEARLGQQQKKDLLERTGEPLKEFSGDRKTFLLMINEKAPKTSYTTIIQHKPVFYGNFSQPKVSQLELEFRTGNDDLRGGKDNLNLRIYFKNGRSQYIRNVNKGKRWADGSRQTVKVKLNSPLNPDQIKSIQLMTTFSGGWNGDNWNLNGIKVREVTDRKKLIFDKAGNPIKRFTGSSKNYRFYIR